MRVDLSTLQAAGFEYSPEQVDSSMKAVDCGASPTLTPQSSCGDLESCEDDAPATGKGRPLPAWLQNGSSTAKAKGAGKAPDSRRSSTTNQSSGGSTVPSWLSAAPQATGPSASASRLSQLRASGDNVLTSVAYEPATSKRSQLRKSAAQFTPAAHTQQSYGWAQQATGFTEHQMDALQAYRKLLEEEAAEANEAMYGADPAAAYAAFQQGFEYGWSLTPEMQRPMKVKVDMPAYPQTQPTGKPLTLAPPPGL